MIQETKSEFQYGWKEQMKTYVGFVCAFLCFDKSKLKFLLGRHKISQTCVYLKKALEENTKHLLETQNELHELDMTYQSIMEHVNIKARAIVMDKKIDYQRRNQPFPGFSRKDLRFWFSKFPNYVQEIERAEKIRIYRRVVSKNEKSLNDISSVLYDNYIRCVHRFNNVDLAEHLKGTVNILRNIKEEGLEQVLNDMFKSVDEFQYKMLEIKEKSEYESMIAESSLAPLSANKPSDNNIEQLMFLDEVIQMTGSVLPQEINTSLIEERV